LDPEEQQYSSQPRLETLSVLEVYKNITPAYRLRTTQELRRYGLSRVRGCSGWFSEALEPPRLKQPQLRNSFDKGNWACLD
jgi:hypothetical protein